MRFLIDTHIAIWLLHGVPEIDRRVIDMLEDPKNEVFISAASVWEAEIKKASGRLPWPDDALARLDADGIGIVETLTADAVAAGDELPLGSFSERVAHPAMTSADPHSIPYRRNNAIELFVCNFAHRPYRHNKIETLQFLCVEEGIQGIGDFCLETP